MRRNTRQKGSITVFSILVLSLVAGCILTLLEGSRMYELHRIARLRTELAVEAAFANYNTTLWETYRLLGCNQEDMQSLIISSANGGYSEYQYGTNLLLMELKNVDIQGYTLLTDGDGKAYIKAVAGYMSKNILYETAKGIYNQYDAVKSLMDSHSSNGTEIDKAIESLKELEAASTESTTGTSQGTSGQKGNTANNPLENIQQLQKTQVLEFVIEDTSKLSESQFDLSDAVSRRELQTGQNSTMEETNWLDRVLLQQYLLTYLSDYTNPGDGRGLNYELEYLIGGRDNDIENLRAVVNYLLLIRETANLAYLFADIEKLHQAQLVAVALAGATANPAIVEVVKIGLLAAWAYAESVLDVRALLEGKRIPLIKSKDTWTLAIESIGSISQEYMVAKESKLGISYSTYLGILLMFQTDKELAYRAMDVQEITLQQTAGSLRMDELVVKAQAEVIYEYAPIFMSLKRIEATRNWKYQISTTADYGYN